MIQTFWKMIPTVHTTIGLSNDTMTNNMIPTSEVQYSCGTKIYGISSYQCGVAGKRCGVALRCALALIRKLSARRARPEGGGLGMVADSAATADSSLTSMLCEQGKAWKLTYTLSMFVKNVFVSSSSDRRRRDSALCAQKASITRTCVSGPSQCSLPPCMSCFWLARLTILRTLLRSWMSSTALITVKRATGCLNPQERRKRWR